MAQDISLEEKLKELEKIANEIEVSDLSLDEAIDKFEKGIKLSKECSDILDSAEKRINILVKNDENGDYTEENFVQQDD